MKIGMKWFGECFRIKKTWIVGRMFLFTKRIVSHKYWKWWLMSFGGIQKREPLIFCVMYLYFQTKFNLIKPIKDWNRSKCLTIRYFELGKTYLHVRSKIISITIVK
jgi:hypothetical protein